MSRLSESNIIVHNTNNYSSIYYLFLFVSNKLVGNNRKARNGRHWSVLYARARDHAATSYGTFQKAQLDNLCMLQ
jgi:hypothetical protein